MGILDKFRTRAEPNSAMKVFIEDCETPELLRAKGYTRLIDCPEVRMAIERIADLISLMTIHLMENGENGDKRINDGLSRKIDVYPYKYMTRQQWVHWIVSEMLLEGNAIVLPKYNQDGTIKDLKPIPFSKIRLEEDGDLDYTVLIKETKSYNYDEILHFKINPKQNRPFEGQSYRVSLKEVMSNLSQASHTTNEFMSNKMMPSLIVKVDALTDELSSDAGRDTIERKFLQRSRTGQPWIIPNGLIDIQQVKPLTLNDIAIKDTIKLSKETVAGLLGVPAFLLGVGTFNEREFNNFIRTRIAVIAKAIEQELTQKLLISPVRYFKFNSKSLYAYSMEEIAGVYSNLYTKGLVTGNEVRDALGMSPKDELNELTILENYIPLDKIGNQEKIGGDTDE